MGQHRNGLTGAHQVNEVRPGLRRVGLHGREAEAVAEQCGFVDGLQLGRCGVLPAREDIVLLRTMK